MFQIKLVQFVCLVSSVSFILLFQNCSGIDVAKVDLAQKAACISSEEATLPSHIKEVTSDIDGFHKFVIVEEATDGSKSYFESQRLIDWSFDKYIDGAYQKTVTKGTSQYLYLRKGIDDGGLCVQRTIKASIQVCDETYSDFPEVTVEHNCETIIPEIPEVPEVPDLDPPPFSCEESWSYGRTRQADVQTFEDVFPNGQWPYSGASSDGVGSSSPIAVKKGKYIAIKFRAYIDQEQGIGASHMISMIEAQGGIAPATGVYVSLSRCPGDARPPNNSDTREDAMLASGCRKYGGTLNIAYGVSSTHESSAAGCILRPDQDYYLNIFLLDPRDGVTDDEHTCAVNAATGEKFQTCGKRFKFN